MHLGDHPAQPERSMIMIDRKRGMTRAARRARAARTAQWRDRWAVCSYVIELHRQNLLATTRRRAREGDPTVPSQYWRFLPAQVRAQVTRAAGL